MLPNPAVILVPIRTTAPRLPDRHIVNPTWTDSPCMGCLRWRGLTRPAERLRGRDAGGSRSQPRLDPLPSSTPNGIFLRVLKRVAYPVGALLAGYQRASTDSHGRSRY
jgi:hypothetical protein